MEVEILHLPRIGDAHRVRHLQTHRFCQASEFGLVVECGDQLGTGVQHLADIIEDSLGVGVGHTGGGARDGHEDVHALPPDHLEERRGVARVAGVGNAVKRIDRSREPVSGKAVPGGLHQHHAMPGKVERPGQQQRLGHLPR